jgi:hypothetical protein
MATTPAPAAHDDIPAMDYPQHEATYRGFIAMLKGSIVGLAFLMLSLYAFIVAGNAIVGVVLLALMIVVPIAWQLMGSRRKAAA